MADPDLEDLARKVNELPPDQRLLLAAHLLRAGKQDLAETIIRNIADELAAIRLLCTKEAPRAR